MATQQTISISSTTNTGSGDSLRVALTKANSNFTPLFGHLTDTSNPHATTAAQVGAIALTTLGAASGVATLDSNALLTPSQVRPVTISGDVSGSGTTALSLSLAASGVVAGTYTQVTVDAKGRVVMGGAPSTLAGYGIADAVQVNSTMDGGGF